MDAIELLEAQHRFLEELLARLEAPGGDRATLFAQLADVLAVHTRIEEEHFYPAAFDGATAARGAGEHRDLLRLLGEMVDEPVGSARFEALLTVLRGALGRHVEEERRELFPAAASALGAGRLAELGNDMEQAAAALFQGQPGRAVREHREAAGAPT